MDKANCVISKTVNGHQNVYDDVILGEIESFTFDDHFILVKRILSEKARFYFEDHPLWLNQLGTLIQYWIIDKSNVRVYGPLERDGYSRIRDSLNIPRRLKLTDEEAPG